MNDNGSNHVVSEQLLQQARHAIFCKQYDQAETLIAQAKKAGAKSHDIDVLNALLRESKAQLRADYTIARVTGLCAAAAGYLVLAVQTPRAWTIVVWSILALALVPSVSGFMCGARMADGFTARQRFITAAWLCAIPMAAYSLLSMIYANSAVQSHTGNGQVVIVMLFVAAVYTAIASAVAGVVSGYAVRTRDREMAN